MPFHCVEPPDLWEASQPFLSSIPCIQSVVGSSSDSELVNQYLLSFPQLLVAVGWVVCGWYLQYCRVCSYQRQIIFPYSAGQK